MGGGTELVRIQGNAVRPQYCVKNLYKTLRSSDQNPNGERGRSLCFLGCLADHSKDGEGVPSCDSKSDEAPHKGGVRHQQGEVAPDSNLEDRVDLGYQELRRYHTPAPK